MSEVLQTRTVVDALYDDLRDRILAGEISAGERLTEVSVSQHYQVARPTAKAAIERLVSEGLLVRTQRRLGAMVPVLTAADIADLYETRTIIEAAAHEILASEPRPLPGPTAENQRLADSAAAGDAAAVVDADVAFHRSLVAATGRVRLQRIHDLLMSETHLCMAQVQARHLLSPQTIFTEHAEMLAAIEAGDVNLAFERTLAHLDRSRRALIASVSES